MILFLAVDEMTSYRIEDSLPLAHDNLLRVPSSLKSSRRLIVVAHWTDEHLDRETETEKVDHRCSGFERRERLRMEASL